MGVDYALENLSDQPTDGEDLLQRPDHAPASLPPAGPAGDRGLPGRFGARHRGRDAPGRVVPQGRPDDRPDPHRQGQAAGWAGASSVYFSALVLPTRPGSNGTEPGDFIAKVTATQPDVASESIEPEDRDVLMAFETTDVKLPPHKSASLPLSVYLGPRWREVLNQRPYYRSSRAHYDASLWSSDRLLLVLHVRLADRRAGLAAAGVPLRARATGAWRSSRWSCIVRLLLHPITKRSQISHDEDGEDGPGDGEAEEEVRRRQGGTRQGA